MIKKILFVVSIILLGYTTFANSAILLDKVMAIVNKEVITWSDLYKAMGFEATDEIKAMKDEDKRRFFRENESIFLESLIDMRLHLQEAAKAGVSASDEDVNKAIENIQKKYSMTDEAFKDAIGKEGFTIAEYRKKLSEQITISRIVEQDVRSKVLVTEGEIDKYLSENKEMARESDGFNISHIFLKKTDDKKQLEEKAMEIYKKIKAGENFSDLAKQYSEDASARSGGELGFIKKSDMSKDFLDVLSKMKVGDVSEPFWGGNGIHIIRLNDKREIKSPQELREAVRQKLLDEKFSREYKNWIKGLREKAYVEIKI
ncbi:MAG: peptidylprolyl isomerase [Nitrospiraceae bacterium]|nr:peptidylprolyl isomerase [Nitrospirota bacterium]MDA8338766.1 peptidylprolyl isomerase [Nitrospiraceae bacterium]